jgi:hypothetical protein
MTTHLYRMKSTQLPIWLCSLVILCLALAGCGMGDGLERYPVNGTVTFEGKPVQTGAVFFEPTASVGTVAPTVYLPLRGGRYDAGKEGPVAGKYVVKVAGWDESKKQVDSDGVTHTAQLFQDYQFEVQIPPPNNTLDIEVPASQAIGQR